MAKGVSSNVLHLPLEANLSLQTKQATAEKKSEAEQSTRALVDREREKHTVVEIETSNEREYEIKRADRVEWWLLHRSSLAREKVIVSK